MLKSDGTNNMPQHKAMLRQWMHQQLQAVDNAAIRQANLDICKQLRQLPLLKQVNTVLAFAPLPNEIDIWPLLTELAYGPHRLCLPRLSGRGIMEARAVTDLSVLVYNHYHIAEPPLTAPLINPESIELVLVPGLAFTKDLWRLGRGGGYYDRFLAGCGAFRLGLAREIQIVEHIPHEQHDLRMQALLSEESYYT